MIVVKKKAGKGEVWKMLNGEIYRRPHTTESGKEVTVFSPLSKVGGILHGRPYDEEEDEDEY